MAIINFLGQEIEIYEHVLYYQETDYWVKVEKNTSFTFGLTPTGAIKEGGYRSIKFTIQAGDSVDKGDVIAVAITDKIKYLESFAGGIILAVNKNLEQEIPSFDSIPYTNIWVACLQADEKATANLVSAAVYCSNLKKLSHSHNIPPEYKRAGSPTCRSVYQSIKEQKY